MRSKRSDSLCSRPRGVFQFGEAAHEARRKGPGQMRAESGSGCRVIERDHVAMKTASRPTNSSGREPNCSVETLRMPNAPAEHHRQIRHRPVTRLLIVSLRLLRRWLMRRRRIARRY